MTSEKLVSTIIPVLFLVLLGVSLAIYTNKFYLRKTDIVNQKLKISPSARPVSSANPLPTPINEKSQQELILNARKDLARKTNTKQQQITTKQVEFVVWNDASLGCPEPGKSYPQVLTPGYKIILQTYGKTYEYHTSKTSIKLCRPKL